jgi:hypothetical protein
MLKEQSHQHHAKKNALKLVEESRTSLSGECVAFDLETPLSPLRARRIAPASAGCQTSAQYLVFPQTRGRHMPQRPSHYCP